MYIEEKLNADQELYNITEFLIHNKDDILDLISRDVELFLKNKDDFEGEFYYIYVSEFDDFVTTLIRDVLKSHFDDYEKILTNVDVDFIVSIYGSEFFNELME